VRTSSPPTPSSEATARAAASGDQDRLRAAALVDRALLIAEAMAVGNVQVAVDLTFGYV
jgi:hypothetical protein